MNVRRGILTVFTAAAAVLATDLAIRSSLIDALWPRVVEPPDGAIVRPPVVVRWDGPRELHVTLIDGGLRTPLGDRKSPFVLSDDLIGRDGYFAVELRSPLFGLTRTSHGFLVRRQDTADRRASAIRDPPEGSPPINGEIVSLTSQLTLARRENAILAEEGAQCRLEREDLMDEVDELLAEQAALRAEIERAGNQLTTFAERLQMAQIVVQRYEAELDAVARTCPVWGYLTQPRPQTVPPSQQVVVSDRRGQIFLSVEQCERQRRNDVRAMSPCTCIGA